MALCLTLVSGAMKPKQQGGSAREAAHKGEHDSSRL